MTVGHKITIGSSTFSSSDHSRLVALRVRCALDVPVNSAAITLAPPDGIEASPDAKVAVELGYDGNTSLVFTGLVDSAEYGIDGLRVHALGSFRKLLAPRFNLLYEQSTAGDILSAFCGRVGLKTGNVEDGPQYPSFAFGDGASGYEGLRAMADQCGFDVYANSSDELVFAKYAGDPVHPFQYGVNVLSLRVEKRNPLITGTAVYGESPASLGQGSDASSWLTKKTIVGNAGDSGGLVLSRFEGTARTQDAAGHTATAFLAELGNQRVCALKALGAPEVQLGHAIQVSKMPADPQNGTYKVIGIEHRLNSRTGFITIIQGLEV